MKIMNLVSRFHYTLFTAIILVFPLPSFATVSVPENFYPCTEFKDFPPNKQALYEAVKSNDTDIALKILPTVEDVNYCTPSNDLRLLDFAIGRRNLSLVKDLLEKGADINCEGNCRSAMLYVIDQPNSNEKEEIRAIEIGNLLLTNGASLEHFNFAPLIDSAAPRGRRCASVGCAARNGNKETVKWLLDHGAAINSEEDHWTPLSYAAVSGDVATAKVLLDLGANPNGLHDASNVFGSPLIYAASKGYPEMVALLISHGANVNQIIHSGSEIVTPLKWARKCAMAQRCDVIVEMLINAGEKE